MNTMGRPSKSAILIENEGKSHRTKAEIASRKEAEQAALTGTRMREYPEVREDEVAHAEYRRIKKILSSVGKDDSIYEAVINEYCILKSDIQRYTELRKTIEDDKTVAAKDRYKMILDCDRQIDKYKRRRFDIEKENGMTIASALRAIPKKPEKKTNPLLEALKDDG